VALLPRLPPPLRSVVCCLCLALGHAVFVERVRGKHGGGRGVAAQRGPLALTASSPTASRLAAAALHRRATLLLWRRERPHLPKPLLSGASCPRLAPEHAVAADRVGCKRGLLEL